MIIFVWSNIAPVGVFSRSVGVRTNPLMFPFIAGDIISQLILIAGIIFLFSDAPFIDNCQPYIIIRSKRYSWVMGQIVYIIIASAVYFLVLMLVSVLILLPSGTFATDGWGKLINTLSQTNAGNQIGLNLLASDKIISYYSPIQAFVMCFLLEWAVGTFFGLLIFCINLNFSKTFGLVAGGVVLFLDILVTNAFSSKFFHISPVSLARLDILDPLGVSAFPTVTYALVFFGVCIFALCTILILTVRSKPIEIISEI